MAHARAERVRKSLLANIPPSRALTLRTVLKKMGKSFRIREFEEAVKWAETEGIVEVTGDTVHRVPKSDNGVSRLDFASTRDKPAASDTPPLGGGKAVKVLTMMVTPAKAAELLTFSEKHFVNRSLSNGTIEMYAREMKAGKWCNNGDVVRINPEGYIVDGQHRMWAVVNADVPVEMNIMFGFDNAMIPTVDTGRKRRVTDWLKMNGFKNVNVIQSVLSVVHRYRKNVFSKSDYGRPSMQESLAAFIADKERYLAAASWSSRWSDLQGCPRNGLGLLHYWISKKSKVHNRDKNLDALESFAATLRSPVGLTEGHPILALLRRMKFQGYQTKRVDNVHMMAILIKAWNYTLLGREVSALGWKRHGSASQTREDFPEILMPE